MSQPNPLTETLQRLVDQTGQLQAEQEALTQAVRFLLERDRFALDRHSAFNAQKQRQNLVAEIIAQLPFDAILETGTWFGETTGFLAARFSLPVRSCELIEFNHQVAECRLAGVPDIDLRRVDSRAFLDQEGKQGQFVLPFIYLDAHWHDDLPLRGELSLVAQYWQDFVVMVDDFRVPGDPGYQFDAYSGGRTLELDLIEDLVAEACLSVWYPSARSDQETGRKRGCVVLGSPGMVSDALSKLAGLRQAEV